jgi:diguanylate cyclase
VLTQAVVEKLDVRAQEVGELRNALERAQSEALLDPLTGLKNRRAFERAVGELAHETAGMANAALLLIDIDHFKGVNDTYGHLFGDKVLRAVAHVLQANIKGRDLVARMGGEEFAILFVQATASGALAVAEQIRTAVAQGRVRSVAGEDLTGAVTVSAGLAVSLSGDSLENLIERADSALYEAKRSGRNRVCVAAAPAR